MNIEFPLYDWQTQLEIKNALLFFWKEDRDFLQQQPCLKPLLSILDMESKIEIGRNISNAGLYSLPFSKKEVAENPHLMGKIRHFLMEKMAHSDAQRILLHWGKETVKLERQINEQLIISYLNLSYHPKYLGFKETAASPEFGVIVETPEQKRQLSNNYLELCKIVLGMITARKISDLPSDIATPEYIAKKLNSYAHKSQLSIRCLDAEELQNHGLNTLYAVGKSGLHPPFLIQVDYQGSPDCNQTYCFVGKGITFDTGGLWLKTGDGMKTMKYDMCGAALLIGLLETVVENSLPINIRIIVGVAENMINEKAMRPGEIVRSYSGKTIEIINTDAEGRLILADLLSFAAEQKPSVIIDVATLTGAVVKALGYDISGVMTNNTEILHQLNLAAIQTQEAIWQLPCDDRFLGQVESHIADYCNTPPNNAAICVSAGYFLSRFVNDCTWAHLDISGTTLYRDQGIYSSGKPLHLLYQFLKNNVSK
ncbi:M17 family metallopeptidase [Histophilus somni]|uniref:M17 family metallopeptidase n=1 Tax=Histophilus somni TaxID=731 RepID=UPI00201F5632|nr:leucyl aminopeptidase family protein [Histophilus somni]